MTNWASQRNLADPALNVWDVNDHVQVLIRSGRPADTAALRDPDTRLDSRAVGSPTETR